MALKILLSFPPETAMRLSPSRTALPQRRTNRCGRPIPWLDLLRRHIGDGSQRRSRTGQMFLASSVVRSLMRALSWPLRRRNLRQSKVQNLGVSALGDEDVRRLDVAMNDAFGVRRVQRIGNLDGE